MKRNITLLALFSILFNMVNAIEPQNWPQGYYEALYTDTIPVIDGIGNDSCWLKAVWAPIDQRWIGPLVNSNDYAGRFKVLWTSQRLYILIEITDDSLRLQAPGVQDVCTNIYNYDCTEIFIDENYSRDVNYSNSYKAIAYHMDTSGHVCYANGSYGWQRLDDHINYKMKKVGHHLYHYEYEMKVFNDTYVYGGENTPVVLTENKLMGWSIAYNDNDKGTTRQNMYGSKYVPGNTDNERNISYFNASVFGDLKLVKSYKTNVSYIPAANPSGKYYVNSDANKITIQISTTNPESYEFRLFNTLGNLIAVKKLGKLNQSTQLSIDISNFASGLYILEIKGENNVTRRYKIIK